MKPSTDPRPTILSLFSDLTRLGTAVGNPEITAKCSQARERLELGLFRLVVMGEIKKGKSSFINALLGDNGLLPVDCEVSTSTVYKLIYGPEKCFKIFFHPDQNGLTPETLVVPAEKVASYGTETGNPNNQKNVAFIGVELPNLFLKQGLVLVDTPGVGGLYKAHRDITWKYAPNADAVVFVLDSVEAVISKDEIEFLKELTGKVTKRIFFVQTKTDAVGEEQWKAWRDRNLQILESKAGIKSSKITYFPVSSKLKSVADHRASARHLASSGFPVLLDFLENRLIHQKHISLASDLACQLLVLTKSLHTDLAERQRILKAGDKSDFDNLRNQYEGAHRTLEEWQRTRCPLELREFNRSMADLKQKARYQLQEALDPTGPAVEPILEQFRTTDFNISELNEKVIYVQQSCLASASEAVGKIYYGFNEEATKLLTGTMFRLGNSLQMLPESFIPTSSTFSEVTGSPIKLRENLGIHSSGFETIRNAMFGGSTGAAIASTGFALVSILFPPAAAVSSIAVLIGAMMGGHKAHEIAAARKREEAIAKLSHLLQDLMRKAQRQALKQFDDMSGNLDRLAEEKLQMVIDEQKRQLEGNLRRIDAARNQNRDERKTEANQLSEWAKELVRIENALTPFCAPKTTRV